MKLKVKLLLLSLVPALVISTLLFALSSYELKEGIYDEAYAGMHATTLAVRDIIENGHSGDYYLDENGKLYKGDSLNISDATEIVDQIKENTDMDVTIFYKETRYLTSLVNDAGERQIGTTASDTVVKTVLENGKDYSGSNVEILGTDYLAYYIPIYQESTGEPIGMVFLGQKQAVVDAIFSEAQNSLLLVCGVVLLFSVVIITFVASKLSKIISGGVDKLVQMSEGNLNLSFSDKLLKRKDELGDLYRGTSALCIRLKDIIQNIKANGVELSSSSQTLQSFTETVSSSMNDVGASVQSIASIATQQASDASDVGETVSEMAEHVSNVGVTVNQLDAAANQMSDSSSSAQTSLQHLKDSMSEVNQKIDEIYEQTNLTNESAKQINECTALISDIASQTKLLSLNASIEASRAGDSGRGFNVVASEIQKLALQSDESAAQIQSILAKLSANSQKAVATMEAVKDTISLQEESIRSTDEMFQKVHGNISESITGIHFVADKSVTLADSNDKNVSASENLISLSQTVAANTEEVSAATQEVNAMVEEVTEQVSQLNDIAIALEKNISFFKIEA